MNPPYLKYRIQVCINGYFPFEDTSRHKRRSNLIDIQRLTKIEQYLCRLVSNGKHLIETKAISRIYAFVLRALFGKMKPSSI